MTALPRVPARREDQVDVLHGHRIADPYRWLEDTDAPETRTWFTAQNQITEDWLAQVPTREAIRTRLTELWDYPRAGAPFERGGRWFQLRNSGLQNQDVLYVMDAPDGDGQVLLDPNELSSEGTVALSGLSVTEDGALVAYATSAGGSDWMTWRVREVATGTDRPDVITWSKFSDATWLKDGTGFIYRAVDPPAEGAEYLESIPPSRLCLHRLGQPVNADTVVFAAPEEPEWLADATVSDDGRWAIFAITRGTAPETQLRILDLQAPEAEPSVLIDGFTAKFRYVTNRGDRFLLLTDDAAERSRIIAVDRTQPERGDWQEVVPERDALLLDAEVGGGRLILRWLADATSAVSVHDLDGTHLHDVAVPDIATVTELHGRPDSDTLTFKVTSFTDSGSLWRHDLAGARTEPLAEATAAIDPNGLVSERVFITASDGTQLPLFLTRRADVEPTGDLPTLLYGYGGFDVPITPEFSPSWSAFVAGGGLLAVAVLRGGGEYGRSWHQAGTLDHKQRVFDDFCDCARWLASSGWTRPARIAINGGSNGGLLVGACVIQHRELFGAAIADVGVLDMLRFHRFTIGWAWKSDFGDPEDPDGFATLLAYSPLHNVVEGRSYGPLLLLTGDHDDRVVPGHSFKFAATLQAAAEANGGNPADSPILLRTETAGGHGAGLPTAKAIAQATDRLAFIDATVGHAAAPIG